MNTLNYKVLLKYNFEVRTIRKIIAFFIVILFLSGLTAIPVESELTLLLKVFPSHSFIFEWLKKVVSAYHKVNIQYPFLLYGYDWLAFAHFVLAILFIGPYKDPVKNIWVIEFGLIACVLIFPLAFIAGHYRGIPIGWQLIDCSFGIFGFIPLWICYRKIKNLELNNS
jgi:hypothetical protein